MCPVLVVLGCSLLFIAALGSSLHLMENCYLQLLSSLQLLGAFLCSLVLLAALDNSFGALGISWNSFQLLEDV